MPGLLLVSVVPLLAAFLLGAVEGGYFHLRRYRLSLFAFPESRAEHDHRRRAFQPRHDDSDTRGATR